MFRPTPQKMARLCYVTPITGHKAYTGKEEEEEKPMLVIIRIVCTKHVLITGNLYTL
jgi:hypothetical protein